MEKAEDRMKDNLAESNNMLFVNSKGHEAI
jgi:hypothetical protein